MGEFDFVDLDVVSVAPLEFYENDGGAVVLPVTTIGGQNYAIRIPRDELFAITAVLVAILNQR